MEETRAELYRLSVLKNRIAADKEAVAVAVANREENQFATLARRRAVNHQPSNPTSTQSADFIPLNTLANVASGQTPMATSMANPSATSMATFMAEPLTTSSATPMANPSATSSANPSATSSATPMANPLASSSANPLATSSATSMATPDESPIATQMANSMATVRAIRGRADGDSEGDANPMTTPRATSSATNPSISEVVSMPQPPQSLTGQTVLSGDSAIMAMTMAIPTSSTTVEPEVEVAMDTSTPAKELTTPRFRMQCSSSNCTWRCRWQS